MNRNEMIESLAETITDHVLDDDNVAVSICDGCVWQKYGKNDPRSGCSGFDEGCRHWHIVDGIIAAAREAAEIVVAAAI